MTINHSSTEWKAIEHHIKQRLETLRDKLEDLDLPDHETAAIRGRIQELRGLLVLNQPSKFVG